MRSDVRTGEATARGGVVRSGLQRVREECQTGGESVLPPDAPAKPAKTGNFFCRLGRRGFRKQPALPAGVAEPTKKAGDSGSSPPSVLFFRSLLWYIETSHDRSRPAEHPTAWSQGEV